MLFSLFLILFGFALQSRGQQTCVAKEVQYFFKIMGKEKGARFGRVLVSAPGKLAVLASLGNDRRGVIYVGHGMIITPPQGHSFSPHILDMNQEFIVVGGYADRADRYVLFVYKANPPFDLKATIPVSYRLQNAKITEKNEIIILDYHDIDEQDKEHCYVMSYFYDGRDTWHLNQRVKVSDEDDAPFVGLVVTKNYLVKHTLGNHGNFLEVFRKVDGKWIQHQTIKPPQEDVKHFGTIMDMEDDRLAVVGKTKDLKRVFMFIYHLDQTTGMWVLHTILRPPGEESVPILKKDTLVMTLNDPQQPTVCGVVYKLTTNTSGCNGEQAWTKVAVLKTNGDPVKDPEHEVNISVGEDGNLVYIGRYSFYGDYVGKVFVYDIRKVTK